jgi:type 1 fimbria pilin
MVIGSFFCHLMKYGKARRIVVCESVVFFNTFYLNRVPIMNKSLYASLVVVALSTGVVHAVDPVAPLTPSNQGSGTIVFKGSIIDAPCSIATESQHQIVDFGQIAASALIDGGTSSQHDVKIKLENCDITTQKSVSVVFAGVASAHNAKWFGLSGNASEAGISLVGSNGEPMVPGAATKGYGLNAGDNTLSFVAWVEGMPSAENRPNVIVPGVFTNTVTWTLTYA